MRKVCLLALCVVFFCVGCGNSEPDLPAYTEKASIGTTEKQSETETETAKQTERKTETTEKKTTKKSTKKERKADNRSSLLLLFYYKISPWIIFIYFFIRF